MILKDAGEWEASQLLGVKSRNLYGKQVRFHWEHSESLQHVIGYVREQVRARQKMRR